MTEINAWLAEQDNTPAAPDRAPDRAPVRDWLVGTNEEARLRLAANEGLKTDPERAARVLRLQYRTGLDAPFLDRNLDDVEYEAAKKGFDAAKFRRESPLVADWLAKSPSHYAAAQDDTPALGYVERQWAYIKDQGQRGALTVELSDIGTAAFLGAATADQRRRQRDIQTQMAAPNDYGITGFFEQIPGAVANQLPILATTLGAQAAGAVAGGATGAVGGAAGGAAVGAVVGATGGGVGALPGAVAGAGVGAVQGGRAGALAGWRLGAALSAAKLEASLAFLEYEEIRNDDGTPLDPSEARGAALVVGAINGALEGLTGIERLTEKIPGIAGLKRDGVKALVQSPTMRRAFGQFAGQIIKTAGVEGLTEALQSLVTHAIGELTTLSQDKGLQQLSPTEIMSRLIDGEAMAEALAEARAGAQGGGGLAAVVTTPELISEITKARRAQQNGAAFAELGKGVEASKLRERSPEALREVLETIEAKGDGKNVYVDAETFTRYFQEQGIDARALAEDLTGSAELYDEAIETGGEIEIPLAAYATKIAASEHGAAMARLLRARSGEMSQDEAERYFQTLDTREQESTAAPTAPTDEIHASIQAQLLEAGHDAATATHYADLYQSVFAALGERGGVDPKTLFERYGLDRLVRRGAEESPASSAIDELDILLDRMRTGDRPQQMEAFGPTLIEFLRTRGVRDDGGELTARDLDANLPRFARRIVRNDGLSLDDAARAAVEAGYLSERSLTALLDAIDQEQSGRPIFAPQNENTGASSTLAALEEIQATLDELQIDVGSTPNEEIKKRLRDAYGARGEASTSQPDDEATRFDQALRLTLFQDSTEKRGYIEFGKDRKFSIRLLEKANLSTFLHESGHLFLEIFGDLAEAAGAKDQIKKDYESLLSYLGVGSRSEIQREHHEKFARTFESYLREGRAPSSALRRAFAAFRAWLTWLYRTAKQLNVTLTPEVRGVLDRLVATDRAIEEAQQDADLEPLFLSAEEAGMAPEEFERYRDSAQAASQRAQETVQAQIVRAFYREREAQYEEERAAVRKAVEAEINLRPEYIALAALQRGTTPEGEPLPVAHQKLSKTDIIDAMGEPFLKRLPKPYVYSLKGGMSLARAAQQFGYRSGSELALALANAKPKDTVIDAETDSRMRERHKDIYRDGTIVDEARAALLNEHRESVMNLEMAALRKRANEARATQNIIDRERREQRRTRSKGREALRQAAIPPEHARATADAFIRKRRINQVHPMTYLRLMREASRRAVLRAANGDYDAAAADKQTEIFNYHMFRASSAAMSEVDDALAYFARLSKTQKRAKIGKAGSDYLEQIDGLLGRFNLRPMTAGQLDKKLALAEWIKRKEAAGASAGEEVSIDERIRNEAFKKHYSELSIDELIGLRDTIKQIDNMATLETNLTAAERKQTRDIAREELIAAAIANRHREKPLPYTVHGRKTIDSLEALGRMMDSSLIKMEQLIDWLDNGDIAGPWRTYLWEGAVRAQADEIDHSTRITARVIAAVNGVPKATRARMLDRVEVIGIERTLTRRDVIGVALNWGNASNRDKLLRGQQWTEEQVRRMLDVLTLEEWTFIQQVWDTLESLWPEIATLQREVTGLPPDKVEAQPVQTRYGTFRGGYYPVMYDPIASEQGALQLASTMGNLTEADYTRATTPKGHTKSRLQAFARPFNLDVDQLPFHVAGVIKDLTHRRWLIDANWLVNDSAIKQTLRDTLGPEYVPLFSEWTKQVINDRHFNSMASMNILRRFVEHFRYNTLIAAMGFKASTMLAQIAGLPNSIDVIGGHERDGLRWLGAGMGRALTAPRETYRLITEKSGEMRHRFVTRDRDLRDKLRLLVGRDDWFARVQQLALYGITLADMVISIPTWWGGYAKALSQGYSDSEAVSSGDRAVRLSQGAGGAKDLSSIAANRDLLARSITMFYTPFSALYSRLRDIGFQFKSNHDVLEMAARIFGVWITAAIVGELLAGRGPDDDEAIPEWALKLILIYPLLSVPVVRDGANAIISDYGYQFSPLAQAGKATAKALISAKNALTEDEADIEKLAVDLYRASKYWLGLPTGQIEITGGYLVSFADGSAEQDSLPDVIHGLIYRKEH